MSEVYTVGSLADVIKNSSQSKKIKSNEDEVSKLTALFSAPKKIPDWKVNNKSSVTDGNSKSKITEKYPEKKEQNLKKTNTDNELKGEKKEKKKQFNGDKKINVPVKKSKNLQIVGTTPNTKKSTKIQGYDPPPGIVHESLLQGNQGSMKIEDESEKKMERKARHKNRRDKTKDLRTIFVGNLPITYDKKQLKKLFRPCGKIENVRFRCPPPADLKLPKRAIAITKAFHSERKNIISYVCFEEEESAKKALSLNGKDIDGFHIRVDICINAKKITKWSCGLCNGSFMSARKSVIKRHLLEQHSGFGYKCDGCTKIFVRDNKPHKGCKYPNGECCTLTFRLTGETGETVDQQFKEFLDSMESKIKEHKTTPATPWGAAKRALSEPGFKKPKVPRRSARCVASMQMTSPLTRVEPQATPVFKTSIAKPAGKANGVHDTSPKPILPLTEHYKPAESCPPACEVSETSDSLTCSEPVEGQLSVSEIGDDLSIPVRPMETLEADSMGTPRHRAASVNDRVRETAQTSKVPQDNTANSTRRVVVKEEEQQVFRVPNSLRTSSLTNVKLAGLMDAQHGRVVLDVGGTRFTTSKATLRSDPSSLLSAMVQPESIMHAWRIDEHNCPIYFLDRDPAHFRQILNYLRLGSNWCVQSLPKELSYLYDLKAEAEYFQLNGLNERLTKRIQLLRETNFDG